MMAKIMVLGDDRDNAADAHCDVIDAELTALFAERLGVGAARARFLACLFDDEHYSTLVGINAGTPLDAATHYIDHGMERDLSPSPCFDTEHVAATLRLKHVEASSQSVMQAWLKHGFDSIAGVAWFDARYYRRRYPSTWFSRSSSYVTFVTDGLRRGRFPSEALEKVARSLRKSFPALDTDMGQLIASIPAQGRSSLIAGRNLQELRRLFMPTFYRAASEAMIDHDSLEDAPDNSLLAHYLVIGWKAGLRPSILFHDVWYREQVDLAGLAPIGHCNPWLHWYYVGRAAGLVPTPLFNTRHYLDTHSDIQQNYDGPAFEHFLQTGVYEAGRSASVYFNADFYQSRIGELEQPSALLDYFVRGQALAIPPIPGLDLSCFASDNPWISNPAEEIARHLQTRLQRLESGRLADLIAEVDELEPQIVRPYTSTNIRMPPLLHPEADLTVRCRQMREALPKSRYDSVVLIPHCRMAGSAKLAGTFTRTLARLTDAGSVLVVVTDLSVFERMDWFPDDVDVFDFNIWHQDAEPDLKMRGLLDLVRGLRAERLININSNLGWQLTSSYGRQLAEWMALYVYLFCWDRDVRGNKGGYPIQWFLPTFDHVSGVFCDSLALRDELRERYAPTSALAELIINLNEPADDPDVTCADSPAIVSEAIHESGNENHREPGFQTDTGPKVFWCGRFDRQKRLDLLVRIAAAMPDVEFNVWGKPVLGDDTDHLADAPSNVILRGQYSAIDSLPIPEFDAFLYTSAWDGMPSVLIEMSTRRVPIVASQVGGVGELINGETGWLIDDIECVDDYVSALREAIEQPSIARQKALRLREHALALCTQSHYDAGVEQMLSGESQRRARVQAARDRSPSAISAVRQFSATSGTARPADESALVINHDITAVLTAHGEGALAAVSYRNFEIACRRAEDAGLTVERIVMLDRADPSTYLVFAEVPASVRRIETDLGDQGAVRNLAACESRGEFIAFLDGDDLWSSNWLVEAHQLLRTTDEPVIAHPEFCRFFSGVSSVFINIDQHDPEFKLDFLRHANYWDAMCMTRRSTHLEVPYCQRRIRDGFAFEDWHWNCETLAQGYVHRTVADTIHFKRRRAGSQTIQASSTRALMPTTSLTDYSAQHISTG